MTDKQTKFELTKEQYEAAQFAIDYMNKTRDRSKRLSQRRNAKLMIMYQKAIDAKITEPTEIEIDNYIKNNTK